jgi:DNA-3-methyladenine glycosylase II
VALARLVGVVGPPNLRRSGPPQSHFAALVRSICGQQLAGSAARAIHGRFVAQLGGDVTPERVLARSPEDLRAVGLSGAKVASIRDLAQRAQSGEVALDRIARAKDEEVVRQLVTVRGVGRWTAEMFLIFQLGRLDVWPVGDLGVRNGYGRIYGLVPAPTARELEPLGEAFRPYRSVAAWYCWRAMDPAS